MPRPNRSVRALLAGALALAVAGTAGAQLTTPALLSGTDPTGGGPIYVFNIGTATFGGTLPVTLRVTGMAYDQINRRVYTLTRTGTGTTSTLSYIDLDPLGSPVVVGNVSGAATNITSGGLAWDPVNGRLLASFSGRLFALDAATAVLTEIRNFGSSANFNGIDVDAVTGALYLVNNSATAFSTIPGRGVYRLLPPYESSPIVRLATPPLRQGVPETDIDGVAVGNGVVYLTTDETLSLYRLRLSDLTYLPAIDQPYTGTGALVGGATYVGSATAGADVGIVITDEADHVLPAVGQSVMSFTVRNLGNAPATGVVASVPLPPGVTLVNASPGVTAVPGGFTYSAGDLGPGQGATFGATLASDSPFTLTATASTTAADVFTGNNSYSLRSDAGAQDLVVTLTPPSACSVGAGQPAQFTVSVLNAGSRTVPVTLTVPIPAGSTFDSSSPAGTVGVNTLTINLGPVAAGAAATATVSFNPPDGLLFSLTATANPLGDANPADNTASATALIARFSSSNLRGLLSTVSGASNSSFPGLVGTLVGTGTLDSSRSANGQWMTSHWSASINNQDDLLVRTNLVTGVSAAIGQEGTTPLPGGFLPAFNTFLTPGVNNAGDYAFSGRSNDPNTATDFYAVKSIGGTLTQAAREGGSIPGIPGTTYGTTISSGGITNSGGQYFVASVVGAPAGQDEAALSNDGATLVYSRGFTPAGAAGPLTDILNTGFYMSADGTRYIFQASTTAGGSRTLAVVGTVGQNDATAIVVGSSTASAQTFTLPGFSSPVSAISGTVMTPEGRWLVRGSNADGEDWVVAGTGNAVTASNIVARTGTVAAPLPLVPGSPETWDPGASTSTNLVASAANPRGDVLVVGKSLGDSRADIVFVLNGTRIIAREGDPVDANGDGQFNDDLYLMSLNFDDQVVLTDEAAYAVVKLRDRTGLCATTQSTTAAAIALVRIPLPPATQVCCRGSICELLLPSDCTLTNASVAGAVSVAQASCNAVGNDRQPCCKADYNKTGGVELLDIFAFLQDWFNGQRFADFTGQSGVDLLDIFAFLTAWFAGPCP